MSEKLPQYDIDASIDDIMAQIMSKIEETHQAQDEPRATPCQDSVPIPLEHDEFYDEMSDASTLEVIHADIPTHEETVVSTIGTSTQTQHPVYVAEHQHVLPVIQHPKEQKTQNLPIIKQSITRGDSPAVNYEIDRHVKPLVCRIATWLLSAEALVFSIYVLYKLYGATLSAQAPYSLLWSQEFPHILWYTALALCVDAAITLLGLLLTLLLTRSRRFVSGLLLSGARFGWYILIFTAVCVVLSHVLILF